MSSALLNLSHVFSELLGPELSEGVGEDRELPRALQADGGGDVSREEDLMLTYGNLFASAFFGPRGALRERRR